MDAKLLRNGKPVSNKEVEIIVKDDKVEYRIKKPDRKGTTGPYQISLSNSQGTDVKDININILGRIYFITTHHFLRLAGILFLIQGG